MWEAIKELFLGQAYLASRITPEGGFGVYLTNDTGAPSVKGMLVMASTAVDRGFDEAAIAAVNSIGVVYQAGIADGQECLVIWGGCVDVLLEAGTSSVHGNWVRSSEAVAGYADGSGASPQASPKHFDEIGHSLETTGPGGLCRILLHFL